MAKEKKIKFRTFAKKLVFHDFNPEISNLAKMCSDEDLSKIQFRVEWLQNEVVRAKNWPNEKIQV